MLRKLHVARANEGKEGWSERMRRTLSIQNPVWIMNSSIAAPATKLTAESFAYQRHPNKSFTDTPLLGISCSRSDKCVCRTNVLAVRLGTFQRFSHGLRVAMWLE